MANEMDLQELKRLAMEQDKPKVVAEDVSEEDIEGEATRIVGADWMNRIGKPTQPVENEQPLPSSPDLEIGRAHV